MYKSSAIEYAKRSYAVFPCIGKVPLTPNGYKDASTDLNIVEEMFSKFPGANIGLVTGKISGIFVLDIDIKEGAEGLESLNKLEKDHGIIPPTLRSATWSGGRHYFFKYPERGMGCKTGIRPGIDIRGDGGYVIVPPSIIKGITYKWISRDEIIDAPEWLLDITGEKTIPLDLSDINIKITSTKRNSTLTSYAGSFRRAGIDADKIENLLQDINRTRCVPPLTSKEVAKIAKSIGRYVPESGEKQKFDCNAIADSILQEHKIIFCNDIYYEYNDSVYKEVNPDYIRKIIKLKLNKNFTSFHSNEVMNSIRVEVAVPTEKLNLSPFLNIKNGMFDVNTLHLMSHDPNYNSTIQLPVFFTERIDCPLWIETLNGIFADKSEKERTEYIQILQEFFGLCLTREVKYDKALFLLGEGRNGKSTLLYVLEHVLGQDNYSAVTLEALTKPNYVSEIFGKLANISIETNARTSIYDAMFKAIVSGDTVSADRKYGHPFKFRPFCKMIFALNNMPQVSDKTDAFFKRLIILRLTRQFNEENQDKDLKYKLVQNEISGIFLWMVQGYNRLRKRGYFDTTITNNEAEEYRKENNSVIEFVDEECILGVSKVVTKKALYSKYVNWCKEVGLFALGKNKFGKQISKHFLLENDEKSPSGTKRIWTGIGIDFSDKT